MSPSITFNSFTPSGTSRQRHRRRHRRPNLVQRPGPLPVLFGADSARDPPSGKQHSSLSRPHEGCSRSRHAFHRKCQRDVISGGLFRISSSASASHSATRYRRQERCEPCLGPSSWHLQGPTVLRAPAQTAAPLRKLASLEVHRAVDDLGCRRRCGGSSTRVNRT
nr:uncharacterized protein LOC126548638 [Dermacentor andersoni]